VGIKTNFGGSIINISRIEYLKIHGSLKRGGGINMEKNGWIGGINPSRKV
jgi:hypothetical protein